MTRILIASLAFAIACAAIAMPATASSIAPNIEAQALAVLQVENPGSRIGLSFTDPAIATKADALYGADLKLSLRVYDKVAGRFELLLDSKKGNEGPGQMILTGTALAMVAVPVLTRDLRLREIIGASDIAMADLPASKVSANAARSHSELVGQSARRPLRKDTPVDLADVKRAVIIAKGDAVTIRFFVAGLDLTASGQAMSEAAAGQALSVLNARSRRSVEAVAIGPGLVEIREAGSLVQTNAPLSISSVH
jgi:flagella basal body P-ring formation protein FlgA